jgi:hypothetical protein
VLVLTAPVGAFPLERTSSQLLHGGKTTIVSIRETATQLLMMAAAFSSSRYEKVLILVPTCVSIYEFAKAFLIITKRS